MASHAHAGRAKQDLLAAAMAHASRGWHVFPLRPGSKQPALHGEDRCPRTGPCRRGHQGWEKRATTDPARIRVYWMRGPWNVAIACGRSGLVVIDLDTPKPDREPAAECATPSRRHGAAVLAELCRRHGQAWPFPTFTVATPTGTHLYFVSPDGTTVRNTAGRLGSCIDTRAAGGYVVAPGSIIGSRVYTVVNPTPPAPLPAWLTRQIAEPAASFRAGTFGLPSASAIVHNAGYAQAALHGEVQRVATAPAGQRNDTLNRAAFALGQLAATGLLPTAVAYAALSRAARLAGLDRDPGCGLRGIDRTIRSGLAAGARNPRNHAA